MATERRDPAEALILQLLEWIDARPRSVADANEVWRTSCPRLSIWEDACIAGLVDADPGDGRLLRVSAKGRALLARHATGRARVRVRQGRRVSDGFRGD